MRSTKSFKIPILFLSLPVIFAACASNESNNSEQLVFSKIFEAHFYSQGAMLGWDSLDETLLVSEGAEMTEYPLSFNLLEYRFQSGLDTLILEKTTGTDSLESTKRFLQPGVSLLYDNRERSNPQMYRDHTDEICGQNQLSMIDIKKVSPWKGKNAFLVVEGSDKYPQHPINAMIYSQSGNRCNIDTLVSDFQLWMWTDHWVDLERNYEIYVVFRFIAIRGGYLAVSFFKRSNL
jgi:hypothetical protein